MAKIGLDALLKATEDTVVKTYTVGDDEVDITFRYPPLKQALPVLKAFLDMEEASDADVFERLPVLADVVKSCVVWKGKGLSEKDIDKLIRRTGGINSPLISDALEIVGAILNLSADGESESVSDVSDGENEKDFEESTVEGVFTRGESE